MERFAALPAATSDFSEFFTAIDQDVVQAVDDVIENDWANKVTIDSAMYAPLFAGRLSAMTLIAARMFFNVQSSNTLQHTHTKCLLQYYQPRSPAT